MSVKYKKWFAVVALVAVVFGNRSCNKPEVVAELFIDDYNAVRLVKRSMSVLGGVWDLRVEVYHGRTLVGVETLILHRDLPRLFPEIVDVEYNNTSEHLSVFFEKQGKIYRIHTRVNVGKSGLYDYIKSGEAVELGSSAEYRERAEQKRGRTGD
jgi:hypothetical protein